MEYDKINNRFYVTIDSIMDVRYSILLNKLGGMAGPEAAELSMKYLHRCTDYYLETKEEGEEQVALYKKRTVEDLSKAGPSVGFESLFEMALDGATSVTEMGGEIHTVIYINFYPYELTEKELAGLLDTFVAIRPWPQLQLVPLWVKPLDITAEWVRAQDIRTILDVDGWEWIFSLLDNPAHKLKVHNMSQTKIYVPKVVTTYIEDPRTEVDRVAKGAKQGPYESLAWQLRPLANIQPVSPIEFMDLVLCHSNR